ncbi:hypothetical protein [Nocardioides aestuarii]|uniref:Uncharacterized protein n=1 Tax=Nocardioides aestuarii TaxID=252231 RepID=A0ABW4TRP5_9ACTN
MPRHLQAREERRVDDLVARRLIRFEALVDAMLWAGNDDHQLANELWVDVATVRARLAGLSSIETAELNRRLDEEEVWIA